MMGSSPFSTRRWAAASDDRWTWAPVLSVQLMASTDPRSTSARRQVASGSALLLEESSPVTANRPSRSKPASRLTLGMRLPTFWRELVSAADEVDPRRRALQLPINRLLQMQDVIFEDREASRPLPRFAPDATLIRVPLAVAVRTNAAARTVTEILGTAHRAAQAG